MNKIGVILKINIKLIILIWNRFGAKNCTLQTNYSTRQTTPNKKGAEAPNSINGASSGTELQPLFQIIDKELECTSALIREIF